MINSIIWFLVWVFMCLMIAIVSFDVWFVVFREYWDLSQRDLIICEHIYNLSDDNDVRNRLAKEINILCPFNL